MGDGYDARAFGRRRWNVGKQFAFSQRGCNHELHQLSSSAESADNLQENLSYGLNMVSHRPCTHSLGRTGGPTLEFGVG
jgi:hypothetical protein